MKRDIVIIRPDGTTEVRTEGYTGEECMKAVQELEADLGKRKRMVRTGDAFVEQQADTKIKGA